MSSMTMSEISANTHVEVKDLYQAISGSRSWDARWSEYKDPGIENQKLQPYRASFPIIHKRKCFDLHGDIWKTYSVEVNDRALRKKVEEILADVPGLDFDVEVLKLKPPFAPFLHQWSTFRAAVDFKGQGTRLQRLLRHLYDIIAPVVSPTLDSIKKARDSQTVDWQLFESSCVPGELLYGTWFSHPQAFKIIVSEVYWGGPMHNMECLKLEVEYYDWDGQKSGFRRTEFHTEVFKDEIPLSNLAQVPFKFLKRGTQVQDELITRGKKFESLIGYHFKHYTGTKLTNMSGGKMKKGRLDARIIVDAFAYHTFCEEQWIDDNKSTNSKTNAASDAVVVVEEEIQDENGRDEVIKPFTEEQHLLSIPTVKAFDIDNREWCQVFVDGFSEIVFNDNAYDKLVLEESEKEMILAFSEQVRDRRGPQFDDFIKNKGRGVLMLLCGSPGVGKTLTAESVTERAHLPLYAVSAGEIGHDAYTADDTLRKILECCRLWNAVLLLDEADVFLEARGTDSLTRNELVSVSLRRLEYFGKISFLTTNRPRSIDPAFQSRLDLIIPYPDPDTTARRAIWATFISQSNALRGHEISQANYDKLADHKCNGREIKNIVKISSMLANREKSTLTMNHIATVLRLRIKAAKMVEGAQSD